MGFLELFLLFVASSIVAVLLRPKIKDKTGPGDFRPPEPREGEPIPIVFGTSLVSPSITWFGDVSAKKVNKTVSTLFGLVKDKVPLGYEYYAGMMFVLCHGPIDELLDIYIGENRVVRQAKYVGDGIAVPPAGGWPETHTPQLPQEYDDHPTRISINLPDLFGGQEEGGGVVGQMDVHWGSNIQGQNDYLAVFWGTDILPQYRNLAYVVLRRMNVGKSPSPQPWKFVIKRIPDVLNQSEYSEIGDGTANGAEVIYEILTNAVWGLGKPRGDIDEETFKAAAQTLHGEGLGYSGTMSDKGEAWQKIKAILDHFNGVLYQDPTTGLIAIKLIRDDYTLGELVELDETNCIIDQYTRGSWAETVNETAVQFTDVARRFTEAVAQAQNLAAIQAMEEVISNTISLPGLTTHALALDAAEQSNRVTSVPLIRLRIRTNRIAYAFHQGKPFKVSYPEYSISDMVCRVTSVNYGSLTEGTIEIEALQDPWDLSGNAYASPDDLNDLYVCGPLPLLVTGYDPGGDPSAVFGNGFTLLFEAPYWHVGATGRAWVAQTRSANSDLSWDPWVAVHGTAQRKLTNPGTFTAVGYLEDALAQTGVPMSGVSIEVYTAGDMEDLTSTDEDGLWSGERMLMIDGEIMAWKTITNLGDGLYRIDGLMRGQCDTLPEEHPAGTRVHFYYNSDGAESALDITDPVDLDPYTQIDLWPQIIYLDGSSRDLDKIPKVGLMVGERALAPLPPGDVRLFSYGYENWLTTNLGSVTLNWANRSRTQQTTMVSQDDPQNYTIEGTLTVEVLLDGEPVREWTGLTGTSQEYTWAQRIADDPTYASDVQFRITPIGTGGEVGTVRTTPRFKMLPT